MHVSYGVASGAFTADAKPPNIKRPMTVEELARATSEFTKKPESVSEH